MILPALMLLIFLLLLLAATRHFFSQHQLTQASHGADYEKAYHLAVGGLESIDVLLLKAVDFINDGRPGSFPKLEKAPAELKPILKGLLDSDGQITPREAKTSLDSELFKHLQQDFENYSSLKVEIELRKLENLFASPIGPGLLTDEREMKVMIMLHAEASVHGAFARVYRYREAKVVNILPPVVGKFVLFLREQGSLGADTVQDSISGKNQVSDSPLLLYAGDSCSSSSLEPAQSRQFFDRQGWVFLGSEAPWNLGCGPGGGDDNFASVLPGNSARLFAIPEADTFSDIDCLSYYSQPEFIFKELRESDYHEVMKDCNADDLMSARIRIAGSADRPTPTVVLGKAISRWTLLQGLMNELTDLYAPFPRLDENSFSGNAWPGMTVEAVGRVRDNFAGDYQRYRERMSSIVEESCNAANLRVMALRDPDLSSQIGLTPGQLPADLPAASERALVDRQGVSFFKMNHGSLYQLNCSDGRKLFDGNLADLEDLGYLRARVGQKFATAAEFFKKIENEKQDCILNDVYYVAGDLEINRSIAAENGCGGMLLVEGNITIREPVSAPAKEPVVIISLAGNLRVATAQPVEAALIALKGTIFIESSSTISGLLAARNMGMSRVPGLQRRNVTYNENLDVTDAEACFRSFRLYMKREGVTFVR
jgi:hypothetical protein